MTYITGHDRSQLLLLLEAVDDYVGSDNPARFIDGYCQTQANGSLRAMRYR